MTGTRSCTAVSQKFGPHEPTAGPDIVSFDPNGAPQGLATPVCIEVATTIWKDFHPVIEGSG